MINSITGNSKIRRGVYIVIGVLALAMMSLSIVQLWVLFNVDNVPGYGSIAATSQGWPDPDQKGAFILLNEIHNPLYQGSLIKLLDTTEPGVVDEKAGAHLISREIKGLLIQTAALNEMQDYRVYRLGDPESEQMKYDKQPGGKDLVITPASGSWKPGNYIVDIPVEGMDGGRIYYQFYVDQETP